MKTSSISSGILLHISSLPSPYGIGTLGQAAYQFVDFLAAAGQSYWQILPCGMTGYANSPYQSSSAYAGNIYFIDLNWLCEQGYLKPFEFTDLNWGANPQRVDYDQLYRQRCQVLKQAAARYTPCQNYLNYCTENSYWLADYALFMALKEYHQMASFDRWEERFKLKEAKAVEEFARDNQALIDFYQITQFWFNEQYQALKSYANSKGIQIIGDMPFYVAYDSADVWANPQLFELDENLNPLNVAGVPPDAFSADGQLWGNPLYNYDNMAKDNFRWWQARFNYSFKQYDLLRVDHFRAFDSYYAIPYGRRDARVGQWRKGLGYDFFLNTGLLEANIIAEDLGDITDDVRLLIKKTGFPMMKVLQFAFGSDKNNEFLPFNYSDSNCVAYTGTHDNNTTKGWYKRATLKEKINLLTFLPGSIFKPKSQTLINYAMSSIAALVIIPMQDYLNLGEEARMNTPSTVINNWEWRLLTAQLTEGLAKEIDQVTAKHCRNI